MRPDHLWLGAHFDVPLSEHVLEFFKHLEAAIYERLVAQRQKTLDRVQFEWVGALVIAR